MDEPDRTRSELDDLARLVRPTPAEDFPRLLRRMATHMEALEEQQYDHEYLDLPLAIDIAGALSALVENVADLDSNQRALLRGGLEYFLLTTDADNDVTSPVGLRDDARILNHVATELGRPDLRIDLPD